MKEMKGTNLMMNSKESIKEESNQFVVRVRELLKKDIIVTGVNSYEEAEAKVAEAYYDEKIVLSADDYDSTDYLDVTECYDEDNINTATKLEEFYKE